MTRKNVASFPQEVKDLFTQNKDMLKELLQESVQEILEAQMSDLLHDGDVRAGRLHAEGRAYHGEALRRGLQRGDRQLPDVGAGREAGEIRAAEAGGGISVSHSGREIREGQDRRDSPVAGRAHSPRCRLGRAVRGAGRGAGRPRKRVDLEGLPQRAGGAGAARRGVRGRRRPLRDCGIRKAVRDVLPGAAWRRCHVHFLRNALDHLPRKADPDRLVELRWLYDRRNAAEARRDLAA